MGVFHWLQENWFDLLQTAAIVGGFVAIHRDKTKQRIQNWIHFTERHAELSRQQMYDPKLSRMLRLDVDLSREPVAKYEEDHVRARIHHLAATHYATENGVFTQPAALPADIKSFFRLPIPKVAWERAKIFHEPGFVEFVESHLRLSL